MSHTRDLRRHLLHTVTFLVLFFFLFMITRTLRQDDLAAAFSTTSLTEQNYSRGLVDNVGLFTETIAFYFV